MFSCFGEQRQRQLKGLDFITTTVPETILFNKSHTPFLFVTLVPSYSMLVCSSACVRAFVIWATILYDPVLLNIYNIQNFTLMKMITYVYQ
jgi:hypothetical protein